MSTDNEISVFKQMSFLKSVVAMKDLPQWGIPEVAIAGRSNVGKSSVINCISSQKKLAHISKTPGRTQALNYFSVGEAAYLVDLPGYGYAKVAKDVKQAWHKLLENYLITREQLCGVILIMDIRHPLTPLDYQMCEWLQHYNRQVHIILNKADKFKRGRCQQILLQVAKDVHQFMPSATVQLFSAHSGLGADEARAAMLSLV